MIHSIINLRGLRQQSFKFSFGYKGGMKQCKTKGCEIFVPLAHALKGVDISDAIHYEQIKNKEL